MKFSITDFFNKCDQILRKLRICSDLLRKSIIENFIFVQWYNHGAWSWYVEGEKIVKNKRDSAIPSSN